MIKIRASYNDHADLKGYEENYYKCEITECCILTKKQTKKPKETSKLTTKKWPQMLIGDMKVQQKGWKIKFSKYV